MLPSSSIDLLVVEFVLLVACIAVARWRRNDERHCSAHRNEGLVVGEMNRHPADAARIDRPFHLLHFDGDAALAGFDFGKDWLFALERLAIRTKGLLSERLHLNFDGLFLVFHCDSPS
jgi:hypothetical protein